MSQYIPPPRVKILVVENEAIIRIELAAQLGDMGLQVLIASNADQAIALLDAHPDINVLMTDVTMPGSMDGVRLAHHVRNRWPPIKIVATSGRLGMGVDELPSGSTFFAKPYSPETVKQAITSLLEEGPARRAA